MADKEQEHDNQSPEVIPPEVLEKMSEPSKTMVTETIGMFAGPMANPIAKKVTSDHITKMLDESASQTDADIKYRSSNRFFVLCYVFLAILVFAGITYWFSENNAALYKDILTHFGALVAGIAAGWGYSESRK